MKRELAALFVLILLLVAFPASLFAYQGWRTNVPGVRVIDVMARSPANGGWQPDAIRVTRGERVRLRLAAQDVVHGFSVPALGLSVDEIQPGHVAEVEFTASQVGRFPFTCTRWCSADHWRMRGVIEVVDPARPNAVRTPAPAPLYQQYSIDIDAAHPAPVTPMQKPSATRGARLRLLLPSELGDARYMDTHSPSDVFALLRGDPTFMPYTDAELWDAVAFAFKRAAGEAARARGQKMFAQDCAACHGETGKGDGPAGRNLPGASAISPERKRGPADFTDGSQMFGASDALLNGKILRGGMGTGMPEWGSLYAQQAIKDVIAFIRSFSFDYR